MAITSADGLFRSLLPPQYIYKDAYSPEAAGQMHSAFYIAGNPGQAAVPAPGIAGAALTSYAGQLPFPGPVAGKNVYLANADFAQSGNVIGAVYIFDRLWHNSGVVVTTTTSQAVNSVAFPPRDLDGTINGRGCGIALEVSSQTGNVGAVSNTSVSYTNTLGVAGRNASFAGFPATAVVGAFVPFALAPGDLGVQSIQSITLGTSYVSGAIHIVVYRHIATIPIVSPFVATARDAIQLGLPRLFDNSVPWLLYMPTTTSGTVVHGSVTFAQG